jgi:hypothetical protein
MPVSAVKNIGETKKFDVTSIVHPSILNRYIEWWKWRLTYEGGIRFIDAFLERFSNREEEHEFKQRRKLSYVPAFAKLALKRVRNRTFQRARDIKRIGGPKSYQHAVKFDVDRAGSSMNYFMGVKTLEELLKMSIVGVYVDMPRFSGTSLRDKGDARPYTYLYHAEQIRSFTYNPYNPTEFTSLLLVDRNYTYDEVTNLPTDEVDRYRLLYLKETEDGPRLFVKFYTDESDPIDWLGNPTLDIWDEELNDVVEYEEQVGNLEKIPFVLLDIGQSVLADAANYQIGLMNMASSDIWFCLKAGFPFYTEQYSPNAESLFIRRETDSNQDGFETNVFNQFNNTVQTTNGSEVIIGPSKGRKYPAGLDRPDFIHPSTEPLVASMAKQDQMKKEIDELVEMTVQGLTGEPVADGNGSIASGINYLTETLQWAEQKIAEFWSMYEGTDEIADVKYPCVPEITDPKDIQTEITNILALIDKVPQLKFKKELMKKVARLKLADDTSFEQLDAIYKEIEASNVIIGDPINIKTDVDTGLVSLDTASKARGYPDGEVEEAANDHSERLARIAAAQTPTDPKGSGSAVVGSTLVESGQARGVVDLGGNMDAGKQEKEGVKDQTQMKEPEDPTRGSGKDKNA